MSQQSVHVSIVMIVMIVNDCKNVTVNKGHVILSQEKYK